MPTLGKLVVCILGTNIIPIVCASYYIQDNSLKNIMTYIMSKKKMLFFWKRFHFKSLQDNDLKNKIVY